MTIELDANKNWGLVAYTDGGARPNPGAAGMGMHAYFFDLDEPSPEPKALKFTDGDAIKYFLPAQEGYVYCSKDAVISPAAKKGAKPVVPVKYAMLSEASSNQYTNNYAEMKSFLNAMQLANLHGVKKLSIITDSEYTLKGAMQWCETWSKNGWNNRDGVQIKNAQLWQAIHAEMQRLKERDVLFNAHWIKGHLHPGNYHADVMATIGVVQSSLGIDNTEVHYFTPKELWDPKRDRHPLLSLKRMYFNRVRSHNVPGMYMMADPGKEDHLIGKPLSETVFAIVRMKEPDPILDAVLEAQYRYGQDFNKTMMIKLENIFAPEPYLLLKTFKDKALLKADKNASVEFPEHRPATIERSPIGVTMRAIDSINSLEAVLDLYDQVFEAKGDILAGNNRNLQIHDITPEFYDLVEKKVGSEMVTKKSFKKDIVVGQKSLGITQAVEIAGESRLFTFPLKLGLDTMDRNSLKNIETSDPIVHLVTWMDSSVSLRYATVIRCDEGYAIWSNFYADRLLLKGK